MMSTVLNFASAQVGRNKHVGNPSKSRCTRGSYIVRWPTLVRFGPKPQIRTTNHSASLPASTSARSARTISLHRSDTFTVASHDNFCFAFDGSPSSKFTSVGR